MDITKVIATELGIRTSQVEAVIKLIDEGNTIPFIARYRKEAHGGLNDEVLRNLDERLTYLRNLEERKEAVLKSIEEQEKLTPELQKQIEEAMTLVAVEDLYRPYKQKRRTRATIAKEKGLEGLANIIWLQMTKQSIEEEAKAYLNEEKCRGCDSGCERYSGRNRFGSGTVPDMDPEHYLEGRYPDFDREGS